MRWWKPLLFLVSMNAWGAGFLDHKDGVPYKWKNFPIVYRVDQGNLKGVTINHAAAVSLVQNAFDAWQNVSIGNVSFSQGTDLPEDVTASTVDQYVVFDAMGAPRNAPGNSDTVILFDEDGGILSHFGLDPSSTVGLASAGELDDTDMSITAGVAIMSGLVSTGDEAQAVMTHEFGHMLNLQHSQLNLEEAFDSDPSNDDVVPTMYFLLLDAIAMQTLKPDDQFSLAYLYPSATYANRGTISGTINRRNGDGVRGVNVICRNEADSRADAVSWVSDHVLADKGEYLCGNLNSGNYTVEIQPLQQAINTYDPIPPYIVSEFYSGAGESFDPELDPVTGSPSEVVSSVVVTAGDETKKIKLVANEDGRLISGKAVSGTSSKPDSFIGNPGVSSLDYFITVPPGANQVAFELTANNSDQDIDIAGRCDGEFSLTSNITSDPFVAASGDMQADFFTESTSGEEKKTLNGTSSPKLKNCTYHIIILNFDSSAADFSLKATVTGGNPRLVFVDEHPADAGILVQKVIAKEENFRIREITYTDTGVGDFSTVTGGKIYEDVNQDGKLDSEDTLLDTASTVDSTKKRMTFSNMDFFVEAGKNKYFIVSYTFSSAASWYWLLGAIPLIPWARKRKKGTAGVVAVFFIYFTSCSNTKPDFKPEIVSKSHVKATGLTYGDQISILFNPTADSVSDFFAN